MTNFEHTGRVDCCIVCAAGYWRWVDELQERRQRIKAERGPELNAMWRDLGGEAG